MEANRALYAGITCRFGELDIAASDIMIVLHEPPLENWGVHGVPASELDLSFNLKA